jgi:hypothetical protein
MNTLELSYKLNPISSPDLEVYDNVIFYFYDYTYSLFPNSDRSGWDTIKVESTQPSLPEFSVDSFPLSPGAVMPFTVSSLEITEQITNYNITFLFDYRDRVINIFKNIDFQKQMGIWVSNLFFSKA